MGVFVTGAGKKPKRINYVGFISSTGTQYVDLGFKPNNNTRVVMDVNVQTPTTATLALFGVRDTSASTSPGMFILWTTGTGTKVRSDYFGTNVTGANSIVGTRVQLDKNKNVYTDTAGNILTNTAASGQCTNNMYLFCVNNVGKANMFSVMTLYSCQVYDNDTLIRDLRPVYDPNGVVCLYDEVTETYFYNKGTGNFIAGGAAA